MSSRRSPISVFASPWAHRHLVAQLAKRDILSRYRGSALGLVWSIVSPVLMLVVYTFVFGTVFEARWDVELGSRADFGLMLFAGLIVYWLFADAVNRAPALMFENISYIKKVVFPLEILPWVALLTGLFHAVVSIAVLLGAQALLLGPPPLTAWLLPLTLVPVILMVLGASWFLASLGVYIRDLRQIVPVLTLMILFLCPIFYPPSALPEGLGAVFGANPLALAIGDCRGVLLTAQVPDWTSLAISVGCSWAFAWAGLVWFDRTRRGFADVV